MDDLMTWLRGQLDEDERVARAVDDPEWEYLPPLGGEDGLDTEAEFLVGGRSVPVPGFDLPELAYIADNDPARRLREVDAKRRILDEVVDGVRGMEERMSEEWSPGDPVNRTTSDALLGLLALPYADRPGYRDEWRP